MSARDNLDKILNNIPPHVKLVAVSKFQPNERIQELYDSGTGYSEKTRRRIFLINISNCQMI